MRDGREVLEYPRQCLSSLMNLSHFKLILERTSDDNHSNQQQKYNDIAMDNALIIVLQHELSCSLRIASCMSGSISGLDDRRRGMC